MKGRIDSDRTVPDSASSFHCFPVFLATSLAFVLCILAPFPLHADEVDDILKVKTGNREKVKRFSAEFTVTTHQPKSVKNPKTLKLRYKMKMEKLPKEAGKDSGNPWKMETEVMEPIPMLMKVEGDQAWFQDQNGKWIPLEMTPELKEQFLGMSERHLGGDPEKQRKEFDIKVVRRNNPIFGPKTKTVEYKPKGKAKMFARMEEDVNGDGLPLETRLYDDSGKQTVKIKVKKHHKVKGVPVVDQMESSAETPAGEVVAEVSCILESLEVGE